MCRCPMAIDVVSQHGPNPQSRTPDRSVSLPDARETAAEMMGSVTSIRLQRLRARHADLQKRHGDRLKDTSAPYDQALEQVVDELAEIEAEIRELDPPDDPPPPPLVQTWDLDDPAQRKAAIEKWGGRHLDPVPDLPPGTSAMSGVEGVPGAGGFDSEEWAQGYGEYLSIPELIPPTPGRQEVPGPFPGSSTEPRADWVPVWEELLGEDLRHPEVLTPEGRFDPAYRGAAHKPDIPTLWSDDARAGAIRMAVEAGMNVDQILDLLEFVEQQYLVDPDTGEQIYDLGEGRGYEELDEIRDVIMDEIHRDDMIRRQQDLPMRWRAPREGVSGEVDRMRNRGAIEGVDPSVPPGVSESRAVNLPSGLPAFQSPSVSPGLPAFQGMSAPGGLGGFQPAAALPQSGGYQGAPPSVESMLTAMSGEPPRTGRAHPERSPAPYEPGPEISEEDRKRGKEEIEKIRKEHDFLNPESKMDASILPEMLAQGTGQESEGYFGGLGNLVESVVEAVPGIDTKTAIMIATAIAAATAAGTGFGGPLVPPILAGGAVLSSQ
ncbi:hypothetical protein [uncultured Mediterranean phage uvDeep-CGR2-AD7-C12]|nr:hypothetical protein [uncultured Mediterranean phage uvDeep-CGR2-AD7-C12]